MTIASDVFKNLMAPVSGSHPIDLSSWEFFDDDSNNPFFEFLMKWVAAQVTETLRTVFEEGPPYLRLQYSLADKGDQTDPLMLYVGLPLAANSQVEFEACEYACSLEDAIDDMLEMIANHKTKKLDDPDSIATCAKISTRLRELANKLDDLVEIT